MFTQQPVDESFLASAPHVVQCTQQIDVPADQVFESLAGSSDWKVWLGLRAVEYLTPEPHGPGTRRRVQPAPLLWIHEHFTTWEPGERMTFHFTSSPFPVTAFAEDYRIESVDAARSVLTWVVAIDGPPVITPLLAKVMKRNGDNGLPKLAALLESRRA